MVRLSYAICIPYIYVPTTIEAGRKEGGTMMNHTEGIPGSDSWAQWGTAGGAMGARWTQGPHCQAIDEG